MRAGPRGRPRFFWTWRGVGAGRVVLGAGRAVVVVGARLTRREGWNCRGWWEVEGARRRGLIISSAGALEIIKHVKGVAIAG